MLSLDNGVFLDRNFFKRIKFPEGMIIPVRCFSCGKPIGHLWEEFKRRVNEGENPKKILDELELERYCCRSMFLGQTDLIELVGKFKKS